ncbi:hypothetical protein CCICO_02395 [Corynebacterium ciconiae DSM 44920]|uniref:hypothetical protein n=1 Tax=Corynebacterium ciconiae TaxID=227319 RepID=UPI0003A67070|nr:hypothetical protein [Corynebacterium ciconiae]WKD60530.1 hypothetical protein CCICO_02395 [Corynebacterium ciconiae DSM 44920]
MTYPQNPYSGQPDPNYNGYNGYGQPEGKQPLGSPDLGSALTVSWKVFSQNWIPLVLGNLIFAIISIVILVTQLGTTSFLADPGTNESMTGEEAVSFFLFFLVAAVVSMVSSFFVYRTSSDALREGKLSFADFFRIDRFLGFIGVSLLVGVLTLIGFVLLIIPGLIAAVLLCFAVPAYLREPELGVVGALKRSKDVVTKNLGVVVLALLIMLVISMVGGALPIITVFTTPFLAVFMTVLYEQSRGPAGFLGDPSAPYAGVASAASQQGGYQQGGYQQEGGYQQGGYPQQENPQAGDGSQGSEPFSWQGYPQNESTSQPGAHARPEQQHPEGTSEWPNQPQNRPFRFEEPSEDDDPRSQN